MACSNWWLDCDGGSGYLFNSAFAQDCKGLLTGATCDESTTGVFYAIVGIEPDAGTPCAWAVQPGVELGGSCDHQYGECKPLVDGGSAQCVATSPITCGGTCSAFAPVGSACYGLPCANGYCDSTQTCAAFAALGSPCPTFNECDPSTSYCGAPPDGGFSGDYCNPLIPAGSACQFEGCEQGTYCGSADGGSFNRTCTPATGAGSACSAAYSGNCTSGLTCFDGTCQTDPAPSGAPCGNLVVGGYLPCAQGWCSSADGGVGTCVASGGPGASCDSTQFSSCVESLTCFQGHCTGPATNGSPCDNTVSCAHGYCDNFDGGIGTCTASVASGSPCIASAQCAFPLMCVAGNCAAPPVSGHPCGLPSSAFFDQGCALGDYCSAGQCVAEGAAGAACTASNPDQTVCLNGYCDPTGHCASYLQPGQTCDPTQHQCGSLCWPPPGGGSPVCTATCD